MVSSYVVSLSNQTRCDGQTQIDEIIFLAVCPALVEVGDLSILVVVLIEAKANRTSSHLKAPRFTSGAAACAE